jgi:hypothetical protein
MYAQPMQQLPFSPDQLQRPFIQGIGPAVPPFVPPVQGVAPFLMGYVPTVAGWAAAEIQSTAESNPLRRFFFNMFSQNNFANDDFIALVQSIMDYLEVQLASNPSLRVENILEKTIMHTVEMLVSQMTRTFPQLNGYLAPQQQHNVAQQCLALDNIHAAIQQLRQRSGGLLVQPQGYYPPTSGYAQPMGMVRGDPRLAGGGLGLNLNQPSVSLGMGPGMIQPLVHNAPAQSMSDRWSSSNLPDLSSPRPVGAVVNQPTQQELTPSGNVKIAPSSMPSGYPNTNQNQEPVTVSTPTLTSQDSELEPIGETKLKWARSKLQPYFPAWNPAQQFLFLQRLGSGEVVSRMKKRDEGEMEYDRHKIPSAFGPIIPKLDLSHTKETLEIVRAGIDQIHQEKRLRAENQPPEFSTRVNESLIVDVSSEMVWLKVACNWIQAIEDGQRPNIYRQYGKVVELVVGRENEANFIESFRGAASWENSHLVLNQTYGVCSPTLWHRVNDRLTALVNRVLAFNLSLTDLSIDSFAMDGVDILTHLKHVYGEVVLTAFTQHQEYLIRSIFEVIKDSVRAGVDDIFITSPEEGVLSEPGSVTPVFTHLVSNVSFTFLNCLAHELSVEFNKNEPAILTQTLTPVLYSLVKDLIEEAKSQVDGTVAQYLIQTLDGRIMEVDTGFIGDETYLIRVVK